MMDAFSNKFSMDSSDILKNLERLNDELQLKNVKGEIALVGGAVMCLVFKAREATQDIDAIFEPKTLIYDCIKNVSNKYDLPRDWLNDSVKGFISNKAEFITHLKLSNLTVLVPSPEYILAMKCLSARMDNDNEKNDIKFLLNLLQLKDYIEVEEVILRYYPVERFQAKTKYAIQELLDELFS